MDYSKENKMKNLDTNTQRKEVFDIWDDCAGTTCKALVTMNDLERLGVTEHSGRFRYTPYGDEYPHALNAKQLEMWMRGDYKFEVGYYEYHLLDKNNKVIFNITEGLVEDDMIKLREHAERNSNMTEELLDYVASMLYAAELAAREGNDFEGVMFDSDNIELELAIWVIARGLFFAFEF